MFGGGGLSIKSIRPFLMSPKPNTAPGRAGVSSSGGAVFSAPVIRLTSPRCLFTLHTLRRNLSGHNRPLSRGNKCSRFEADDLLTSDLWGNQIRSDCAFICSHRQADRDTEEQQHLHPPGVWLSCKYPSSSPADICIIASTCPLAALKLPRTRAAGLNQR